jgi:hypothetical protein
MVERIRAFCNRFPEDEGTVWTLIGGNPRFDALCRENANIVRVLPYPEEAETPNLVSQTRAPQVTPPSGHEPIERTYLRGFTLIGI